MCVVRDDTNLQPLYHRLKEYVRQQIENEVFQPGDQIPTEQELMEQFHISRITARRAINDLVSEGLLYRQRGRGTFVSRPKFTQSLLRLDSLTHIARGQGRPLKTHLLGVRETEAGTSLSRRLQIAQGAPVWEVERVRSSGGEPIIFHKSYYPISLCPGLINHDLEAGSMYQILDVQYGLRAQEQEQVLEIALATDYEAGILAVRAHTPLFLNTVTTYTAGRRPIEVVKVLYRGDRCQFTVTPQRVEV